MQLIIDPLRKSSQLKKTWKVRLAKAYKSIEFIYLQGAPMTDQLFKKLKNQEEDVDN